MSILIVDNAYERYFNEICSQLGDVFNVPVMALRAEKPVGRSIKVKKFGCDKIDIIIIDPLYKFSPGIDTFIVSTLSMRYPYAQIFFYTHLSKEALYAYFSPDNYPNYFSKNENKRCVFETTPRLKKVFCSNASACCSGENFSRMIDQICRHYEKCAN